MYEKRNIAVVNIIGFLENLERKVYMLTQLNI